MDNLDILTNVLLHLDPFTLLVCQRINRTWNNVICSTPALQKALFLNPHHKLYDKEITPNPLLLRKFPWLLTEPLCSNQLRKAGFSPSWAPWDEPYDQHSPRRDAIVRAEASWRRMFTHQPPVTKLEVVSVVHAMGGDFVRLGSKVFDGHGDNEGLRMGTVYDIIVELFQQWGIYSLYTIAERAERIGSLKKLLANVSNPSGEETVETLGKSANGGPFFRLSVVRVAQCVVPSRNALEKHRRSVEAARSRAHEKAGVTLRGLARPKDLGDGRRSWQDFVENP